jgi:response regulator RpfG family c-di-GMP phosphodiesterase
VAETKDEDTSKLRLQQAAKGTGNTVAMTGAQLLGRKADLVASKARVFKIVRLADGQLAPQAVTMEFIENLPTAELDKKQFVVHKDWEQHIPLAESSRTQVEEIDPFVEKLRAYTSFTPEERAVEVTQIREKIDELRKADAPAMTKAQAIMDAVEQTFLINKASLKQAKSEVTENERTVAVETESFVNSVLSMVDESDLVGPLFKSFSKLSNGQTINHITRVFSMMAGFIHYFNNLHQQRVGQKIRLIFSECYAGYYRRLFPNLEDIQLTADNMVQLAAFTPPEMKEYALGAFLHDIGKLANFDYFESDKAYDAKQIRDHVFVGTGLILINYGTDYEKARLMAGDHHNALFHKDGYGVSRLERDLGQRTLKETVRCITASVDEYTSGMALGFLPTEMIAIIDIYDAMTDASRTYKKPMSPLEAVKFIEEKQVGAGKLDPILFDLFVDFLREKGQGDFEKLGFSYKFGNRRHG